MTIQELQYFVAVAETKSIQAASDSLFVARQGISRAISRLEGELGYLLFYRKENSLILSEAGQLFLEEAKQCVEAFTALRKKMQAYDKPQRERFVVAKAVGVNHKWMTDIVEFQKTRRDDVDISIVELSSYDCMVELLDGKVDAALVQTPIEDFPEAITYILSEEQLWLALHESHPLAKKESVSKEDLLGVPIYMYTGGYSKDAKLPARPWYSWPEHSVIRSNDYLYVLSEVMDGKGVTFERKMSQKFMPGMVYKPLPEDTYPSVNRFAASKHVMNDPQKKQIFMDFLAYLQQVNED